MSADISYLRFRHNHLGKSKILVNKIPINLPTIFTNDTIRELMETPPGSKMDAYFQPRIFLGKINC